MDTGRDEMSTQTTLFTNGRIYTMDRPWPAEAMAVRHGRIVAVGTSRELSGASGARTIDLGGRTVIPGLIDAHIHFLSYARSLNKVILERVRSKEEALRMVAEKARELGPGRWIVGGGWNHYLWDPPSFPT
ncbi:MAG: amidohydrolase family protein, partial [Chloroflexia bacterium]